MKINLPNGVEIKVNIITIIKIIRLIRKYLKQHRKNKEKMCLRKMWEWITGQLAQETTTKEPDGITKRLLTFGKNNYGGSNNLNGCVNDSRFLAADFKRLFPDASVKIFLDSQVTADSYIKNLSDAVATLKNGATVLIIADSCFSQSVTRNPGLETNVKNRFYDPGLPPRPTVRMRAFQHKGLNVIELSGSRENETSADVFVDGYYQGALTYVARETLKLGITYRQWYQEIIKHLPGSISDQHPQLSGPDNLLDRKIGEGETLWCHNSSHGSWTYDIHGDEADGRDEGLYFDRLLLDDEIRVVLEKIPL